MMTDTGNYTKNAELVLEGADNEAKRLQHGIGDSEHIFLSLVSQTYCPVVKQVWHELKINYSDVEFLVNKFSTREKGSTNPQTVTANVRRLLERADYEAHREDVAQIDVHHLLLGLCHLDEGIPRQVLFELGYSRLDVYKQVFICIPKAPLWKRWFSWRSLPSPHKGDRFTQNAKRVLSLAQSEATRLHQSVVGTEHVLLALFLSDASKIIEQVWHHCGLKVEAVAEVVAKLITPDRQQPVDLSANLKKALEYAVDEARRSGLWFLDAERILLGLCRVDQCRATMALRELGIKPSDVYEQVKYHLKQAAI